MYHGFYVNTLIVNELEHNISYKIACVPSEDLDQHAYLLSLIKVYAEHYVGSQGS